MSGRYWHLGYPLQLVADYYDIIAAPMDFGTMRKKAQELVRFNHTAPHVLTQRSNTTRGKTS